MEAVVLMFLTVLGACVGSFLNVLIYRIPRNEEFVKTASHCMGCGHILRWYELIPVVSWLIQGGKCRTCRMKLPVQYPIVEAANALMWLVTGLLFREAPLTAGLYCVLFSMLLTLSVIDWRHFIIPNGINLVIFLLGLVRVIAVPESRVSGLIGMAAVGGVFLLLHILTGGNGLGMGDVKLVGAAGLLLGLPNMILAVLVGSLSGAIIHSVRMRRGAGKKLAFGPYLAAGIWFAALFGEPLIKAYLSLFGL